MRNGQERNVPKKVDPFWSKETCKPDLERYRLMAIELGAGDAKVIENDQVIVEERVRGKCVIPKCGYYGTNINCPPYSPSVSEIESLLKEYQYGIFVKLIVPSDVVAGEEAFAEGTINTFRKKLYEIVSGIESQAFYDGYYLAMGFAVEDPAREHSVLTWSGSALVLGKGCRHPLWARPSMESVGVNGFAMAARVGWDIYLIGKTVSPNDVPHGTFLGLVLVF